MSSFIDRFAIAGTAGVLGLVAVLGIFGFLSLLGAEPKEPLDGLRAVEEVLTPGFDSPFRTRATGRDESGPGYVGPGAVGSPSPGPSSPTATPAGSAVLSVVSPPGQEQTPGPNGSPGPTSVPTVAPTAPATPIVTPVPTPVPTPAPAPCALGGGTPLVQQNGKHVRIEYGSVVSFAGGVLVVNAGGTIELLLVGATTEVLGDLSAATLVAAEGRRLNDGTVDAERVEVLCPDGAVG